MPNTSSMQKPSISAEDNPFMHKSPLQYQAPEFDKIKDEHYEPVFEFGLKMHLFEIDEIANNTATPTFENTIVALENSGEILKRAQIVFEILQDQIPILLML